MMTNSVHVECTVCVCVCVSLTSHVSCTMEAVFPHTNMGLPVTNLHTSHQCTAEHVLCMRDTHVTGLQACARAQLLATLTHGVHRYTQTVYTVYPH